MKPHYLYTSRKRSLLYIRGLTLLLSFLMVLTGTATGITASVASSSSTSSKNGFDLSNSLIDPNSILPGGPPRDGIPALDEPHFIPADKVDFLKKNSRVLGLAGTATKNTIVRAYPIAILNWHEAVNDMVDDEPVVITYCPLCGTGVAFSANVNGTTLNFGISGLLYNSDVLLYDRQSGSLWSQLLGKSISGKYAGTHLRQIPLTHITWQKWQEVHPDTMVLSTSTGYERDYSRNPYGSYGTSKRLYFPVENTPTNDLHPKETVLGISLDGAHKAYPFSILKKQGKESFQDSLGSKSFTIVWDASGHSARALDDAGEEYPSVQGFWFAWYAFHPDTEVFALE